MILINEKKLLNIKLKKLEHYISTRLELID